MRGSSGGGYGRGSSLFRYGADDAALAGLQFSLREAAVECAEAAVAGRWRRAEDLARQVIGRASPDGDYVERAAVQFVSAIAAHLPGRDLDQQAMIPAEINDEEEMRRAFLAFNQVAPFLRFAHLTANQAILEAVGSERRRVGDAAPLLLHILDVDIMEGVQWPPLMQALGEGGGGVNRVRLWAGGRRRTEVDAVGARLAVFAGSVGMGLEFRAVEGETEEAVAAALAEERYREGDEGAVVVVAINCMLMQAMAGREMCEILGSLAAAARPVVVTVGERNLAADGGGVRSLLSNYCAMFEAMEVTLPPTSEGRIRVERIWLRAEMERWAAAHLAEMDGGAGGGGGARLNLHRFRPAPFSGFALSQARLLLRLHYPADGYRFVHEHPHVLSLAWRQTSLFGVSAWLPPPSSN